MTRTTTAAVLERWPVGVLLTLLTAACATPTGNGQAPPAAGTSAAAIQSAAPQLPPVSRAQQDYYRGAFPGAAQFVARPIPPEMIRSLDSGNDTYIDALNDRGKIIGYLRDISAPVSLGAECECEPLSLTLAFDASYELVTLLTAAPLTKKDHAPFTEGDLKQLIDIARTPPKELAEARSSEAIVDATSGATRREYEGMVVPQAALTTRRVVGLVADTRAVLAKAPLSWDARLLSEVVRTTAGSPGAKASALAAAIDQLRSPDAKVDAYRGMVAAYVDWLAGAGGEKAGDAQSGGAQKQDVEARLVAPRLGPGLDGPEVVTACYRLVNAGVRLPLADQCARTLARSSQGADDADLARLQGSLSFLAGEAKEALPLLEKAAQHYGLEADPILHLRYAEAARAAGDTETACREARALFMQHSLLPGVRKTLEACGGEGVIEELYGAQREALLATRRGPGALVPVLPVEDFSAQPHDLVLADPDVVTVALFFATWCPHCQADMPRIVAFTRSVAGSEQLKGKVRVIGIRTAVEKESEPWESFARRFAPSFPIWIDPVMSLAFAKFAKSQEVPTLLPTVAVVDTRGQVAYLLETGDYRDTARELLWAVDDVVRRPTVAPPTGEPAPASEAVTPDS